MELWVSQELSAPALSQGPLDPSLLPTRTGFRAHWAVSPRPLGKNLEGESQVDPAVLAHPQGLWSHEPFRPGMLRA